MESEQIRETYMSFFEERGHLRVPSASLIPAADDPSVLLTTAGMQPFQPYFLGREAPPAARLTSCQRCFRTPDIEEVGSTARHLTCFEMLGNFAFGDYFKQEAIDFAWELSLDGFGFDPATIWVTVFGGDEELGLGPDTEAIEIWKQRGVPEERIVMLPRSENFWQAGSKGPCGPSSELYIDRGESFGGPADRPGDDTDRFLEYWNLVFTAYDLHEDGTLSELPAKTTWPRVEGEPLTFVAQINLREVAPLLPKGVLPPSGLLSFFLANDPNGAAGYCEHARVIYTPGRAKLVRHEVPDDFVDVIFQAASVKLHATLSLPSPSNRHVTKLLKGDKLSRYEEQVFDGAPALPQLLGYRSHGYDAEEPASSQMLLQLTGDDQTEMQFGDVEFLSFFIHEKKLAEREFGKVWPKIGD